MARKKSGFSTFTVGMKQTHYLRSEMIGATLFLVLALFVAAFALDRFIMRSGSPFIAAVISAVLVDLANGDRAAHSRGELTVNPVLVAAAQAKANHMAAEGYFAHNSPDGKDPWYWFQQVGYDYEYAGENLAMDFSESSDVERAWMNSPSHRDNILNANYTEIGIATAPGMYNGRPTLFVVQMFGKPREEPQLTDEGRVKPEIAAQPSVAQEEEVELVAGTVAVLGETALQPASDDSESRTEEVAAALPVLSADEVPWWAFLITMPKSTLRYAYLVIGLLILFALFLDMEMELRWHHVRHAMRAGMVLATMSILFVAADWVFFAEPILAAAWAFL